MSRTFVKPEVVVPAIGSGRWMVTIYNDEVTPFEDVLAVLMRSTGCGMEEAYCETWEAHTFGRASVHFSSLDECEIVAAMIGSIGVRTQVCREWNEE